MLKNTLAFASFFICLVSFGYAQEEKKDSTLLSPSAATIVIFRTFDFFNFKFSYRLFANDSLMGRIRNHDVIVIKTDQPRISFGATLKAPSLNATKVSNYQKVKRVAYQITLQPGNVYFVQCGFLKQNLFEYPRQPTVKLMKGSDVRKCLRKGFIRRKLRRHLYKEWLTDHNLLKYN
jgi:hypothetical protein